jgi:hypothetical protein
MDTNNNKTNNIEKYKNIVSNQQLIPLLSLKNNALFLPWLILLIIVGIIIII